MFGPLNFSMGLVAVGTLRLSCACTRVIYEVNSNKTLDFDISKQVQSSLLSNLNRP